MRSSVVPIFLLSITGATLFSCSSEATVSDPSNAQMIENNEPVDHMSTTINCDSIYPEKNIKIACISEDFNNSQNDAIIKITKNGKTLIYDSIITNIFAIDFKDFNGDGIKDVLVQNDSDARSNWTWYLYLASEDQLSFKRIIGFEEIKNPNYLEKYDLIDCQVMSGNNWTCFYQIQQDTVHNFGYVVYMGMDPDTEEYYDYDKDYESTLKKILHSKEYH